jgi:hypothetical protein
VATVGAMMSLELAGQATPGRATAETAVETWHPRPVRRRVLDGQMPHAELVLGQRHGCERALVRLALQRA